VRWGDRGLVEAPTFGATAPPLPEKPQVNRRIAYLAQQVEWTAAACREPEDLAELEMEF
jgi:hypothetical protein